MCIASLFCFFFLPSKLISSNYVIYNASSRGFIQQLQNEKGGSSATANIKFHVLSFPAECPTCWTKVRLSCTEYSYLKNLVILTPSAWHTSFSSSSVVCPCPHYSLVEVFLWEVGAKCRTERRSSGCRRSASFTTLLYPFLDCTVWMSNRQKQLMCSQLSTKAAEVNSSPDNFFSSLSLCFVDFIGWF